MLVPIVPEEEPLASLLNILLATACQDVTHLRLHLTQVHLRHFIMSGFGGGRGISEIFKYFCPFTCIPASRHSLNHWMNLSSPEKEKRVRVALSAPSSSGQLCQWGLLWLLEWRLSDIRYPRSKPSFAPLHCWLCSGNA